MGKLPSDLKQKNKKFKGGMKNKKFEKPNFTVKKVITKDKNGNEGNQKKNKHKNKNRNLRKNKNNQKKLYKQALDPLEYLKKNIILNEEDIKNYRIFKNKNKNLRIVLVVMMNGGGISEEVTQLLNNFIVSNTDANNIENLKLENNEFLLNSHVVSKPNKCNFSQFKNSDNIMFINCPRNIGVTMDYLKVADIVLMVSSTSNVDIQKSNMNPLESCNAFDNYGIELISKLRIFTDIPIVSLVPDLFKLPINKQKDVKFYFKRFYEDEFNYKVSTHFLKIKDNNLYEDSPFIKLFMNLNNINLIDPIWRNNRGYMYVDKIKKNEFNEVEMKGYVKGNGFTTFEMLHLTNFGNLRPVRAIILSKENNLDNDLIYNFQYSDNQLNIIKENDENENDDYFDKLNENFVNMNIKDDNIEEEKDNKGMILDEDIKSSDESDISIDDYFKDENNVKKKKNLNFEEREEKELEDEVDYSPDDILREKYKDYKYIKDFKRTNWNIYENLPEEDFKKIKILDNAKISHKNSEMLHLKNVNLLNGFYIKIIFNDSSLVNYLDQFNNINPLILSNLYKHEESKTLMHANCQLHNDSLDFLNSYKNYKIIMGFHNIITNITFSRVYKNTKKTKLVEKIDDYNEIYMASFYSNLLFPFKNCLIINPENENLLMNGTLNLPNPFQVILKRIVLTGYPLKIKKKKAVIRYMFFNEDDIRYYQSNEIYTKKGLRGKIRESLGTHGLMKVHFNGAPKHGDTVCMSLYKRVFPLMALNN